MEELICIESGPDVQHWFVKGNKYSSGVYYDGRRYVLDEDGDEWDLEDAVGETLTVSFFDVFPHHSQRHRIMMLVPTTLREVAVNENSYN